MFFRLRYSVKEMTDGRMDGVENKNYENVVGRLFSVFPTTINQILFAFFALEFETYASSYGLEVTLNAE